MAKKKKEEKVVEPTIDELDAAAEEAVEEAQEDEAKVETASFEASDFSTLSVPVSDQWQKYGTPQFRGLTEQQIRGRLIDEGII